MLLLTHYVQRVLSPLDWVCVNLTDNVTLRMGLEYWMLHLDKKFAAR